MQWYYADDGEQRGPFNDADFLNFINNGVVLAQTLVWNETMTDWQPFQTVKAVLDQATKSSADTGLQALENLVCVECRQHFNREDVIEYQGVYVCGGCKAAFFQRIEEGGAAFALSEGGTGATPNATLTADARGALQGNWGMAVTFGFLYMFLLQFCQLPLQFVQFIDILFPEYSMSSFSIGIVLVLVFVIYALVGVFQLGQCRFYLDLIRGEKLEIVRLFYGFKYFRRAAVTYMLMMFYIMLWYCLLIIPGIIATFSYAMTFYVLADNPEMTAREALRRSKKIMAGNRFKLFCLGWRFVGWGMLALLTCYIGMLWLMPYIGTSFAAFYEDVRGVA